MMFARFFDSSFLAGLFLLMLPFTATLSAELVTLETRPSVSQQFLFFEPSGPVQSVVLMFPGHTGEVRFRRDESPEGYTPGRSKKRRTHNKQVGSGGLFR